MPKRARSPSPPSLSFSGCAKRSHPSPSLSHRAPPQAHLPLTNERLALHDSLAENQPISASMSAAMPPPPSSTTGAASSRSASPSKSSEPKVRDNEDKLRYYGIHFSNRRVLPACLQAFIDELKACATPNLDIARSPNAQHVVQRQRRAQRLAEQDGIDLLKGVLLFDEDDDLPLLAVKAKQNLNKCYLPPPIDLSWVREYGALECPQPDHLFGYRHWKDSDSITTAFSMQQEYGLLSRAVAPALHFPFMSAQWKSPKNNQTHFQARPQGARDGAVIVRYLHQFYTDAGFVPTVQDTAHFSLTIDMESAHLFVHWEEFDEEQPAYYMEPVMKIFLDDEQQVADMRYVMKNILAYAFGSRLANLRAAVEATRTQQAAPPLLTRSSSSIRLFQGDKAINIPPPSPQSLGDEPSNPPQKRQRVLSRASSSNT